MNLLLSRPILLLLPIVALCGPLPSVAAEPKGSDLKRLRRAVGNWLARDPVTANVPANEAYADLTFAFAHARRGDKEEARRLLTRASAVLDKGDAVHQWLLKAYSFRIEQALAGKPHAGPLPDDLRRQFAALKDQGREGKFLRYKLDRLLQYSAVLEPQGRVDPYRPWMKKDPEKIGGRLAALPDVADRKELEAGIRQVVKDAKATESSAVLVDALAQTLPLATRIGDAFTRELLRQAPGALRDIRDTDDANAREGQALLLERSLALAGGAEDAELVNALVDRSLVWLKASPRESAVGGTSLVVGQTLRALRRLKLKEKERQTVDRIATLLTEAKTAAEMRTQYGKSWPEMMRARLYLAGAEMELGRPEKAKSSLEEARNILFSTDEVGGGDPLHHVPYTRIAGAYAAAVARGPNKEAIADLEELFKKIAKLKSGFTTNTHFSVLHMEVIEAAVLGLDPDGHVDVVRP
jgi:hypothetical protein